MHKIFFCFFLTFKTICVHNMFWACNFHVLNCQAHLWACGRRDVSTPSFGSHLNPISTRVGRLCKPYTDVHTKFWKPQAHLTGKSMNNLLSYCGLVDARISASEKDLPVTVTRCSIDKVIFMISNFIVNINSIFLLVQYFMAHCHSVIDKCK